MGKIAGLKPSNVHYSSTDSAIQMLQFIGIKKPICLYSFTSSNKADFSSLGPFILVLDGHIYNPEDFPSSSKEQTDSERILESIQKIGLRTTLEKINGDFALAIYNKQTECLTLARDRFGIKPLYYSSAGGNIGFGSSIQSLLNLSFVSKTINPSFLKTAAALNYRFLDADPTRSPFSDITQVAGGSAVEFKDNSIRTYNFFNWGSKEKNQTGQILHTDYIELLKDAVARRLKKASNPIFTLSGGLDSSAVVAMAHRITGIPQPAISSIHEDETFDEEREIMDIVNSGIVDWEPISIDDPDIFDLLEQASAIHEYPIPTATWLNHFILTEKVKKLGYTSLFTGLGGDELNAGEYDYFYYFFADLKYQKKETLLKYEIETWIKNHDHPIFGKSNLLAYNKISNLTDLTILGQCKPDINLLYKYQRLLHPDLINLEDITPTFQVTANSYLLSHSRNELQRNTMPCCLRASYFNTSAFGISDFHPFLDWRLFELMDKVPLEEKIHNGVTKAFARKAYNGILPESTRTRIEKKGWNAPAHKWFANQGRQKLLDLVSSRRFNERGIYNQTELRNIIDQHFSIIDSGKSTENHMMVIWQIVSLEMWLQKFEL